MELLERTLAPFRSIYLVSIMRVSKKFQAVVCHILRLRLIQAPQRLAELKPLLECGQPSTMPLNFYCTYRETEGLEKNAAEDWRLMEAYTVFVPQPKQAVANSKESCMGKIIDDGRAQKTCILTHSIRKENPREESWSACLPLSHLASSQ